MHLLNQVAEHIMGIHPKTEPYEMLKEAATVIRAVQQGHYIDGTAYRLIVVLRPELYEKLTIYMASVNREWRDEHTQSRIDLWHKKRRREKSLYRELLTEYYQSQSALDQQEK